MNKYFYIACLTLIISACNENAGTVQDEQKKRDSMDAAQRIKDSMDVEAKMLQDMEADTSSAEFKSATEEGKK